MVMAVSFNRQGRLYYLDPRDVAAHVGDMVLVPTEDGPEVAECVWAPQWVSDDIGGLPLCAGVASDDDVTRAPRNRRGRAGGGGAAKRVVRGHELPMKILSVDYVDRGDRPRFIVYFSAPHRVDF